MTTTRSQAEPNRRRGERAGHGQRSRGGRAPRARARSPGRSRQASGEARRQRAPRVRRAGSRPRCGDGSAVAAGSRARTWSSSRRSTPSTRTASPSAGSSAISSITGATTASPVSGRSRPSSASGTPSGPVTSRRARPATSSTPCSSDATAARLAATVATSAAIPAATPTTVVSRRSGRRRCGPHDEGAQQHRYSTASIAPSRIRITRSAAVAIALVVGGEQERAALLAAQLVHEPEHRRPGGRVERPGRLVGEHHRGAVHERPGDRGALLLAPGELRREVVLAVRQADAADEVEHPRGIPAAVERERERDVLLNREVGHQVERLEHDPGRVAARLHEHRLARGREVGAGHDHRPRVRAVDPGDQVECRGLAAPRRADQGDHLAPGQRE